MRAWQSLLCNPRNFSQRVINDRRAKTDALAAAMGQQGIDVRSQVVTGAPFLEIIRQVLRDSARLSDSSGGRKGWSQGDDSLAALPCI